MTADKLILQKLLKIATNQHKLITKMAQMMEDNDIVSQAEKLVKGGIMNWMINNQVNAKYSYRFEKSMDPNFDFDLSVVFTSPQAGVPVSASFPNVAEKFKSDFAQVLATSPLLKDKSIKIMAETQIKEASRKEILEKLAQTFDPPAQSLEPNKPVLDSLVRDKDGEVILAALPSNVKVAIKNLEVGRSHDPNFEKEVRVFFLPGKASDEAFTGVENTVHKLQLTGLLKGQSYAIKEVA